MIKILIETIAEVVAKNQSQTEEILKWIKAQPEQSEPLQKISNRLEAIDVNVRNVPNKSINAARRNNGFEVGIARPHRTVSHST